MSRKQRGSFVTCRHSHTFLWFAAGHTHAHNRCVCMGCKVFHQKKKINTSNNLAVSSSSSSHIWSRTCSNFLHSSSFNMSSWNIFTTKTCGKFAENTFSKQECIPVGCVPPALPPQGGGLRDKDLPWTRDPPPLPVDRMTDACENITLPQTSFADGNNNKPFYFQNTVKQENGHDLHSEPLEVRPAIDPGHVL